MQATKAGSFAVFPGRRRDGCTQENGGGETIFLWKLRIPCQPGNGSPSRNRKGS